jgi:predicted DsbA family dithiol-disulfide isomerase
MAPLLIRDFTDPACPFAFSAEPARLRLRWLYGDQIEWRPRMVVLSQSPDDYVERGFTPERQAGALESIKAKYGMPTDTRRRPRMMATVHACRAVVAARLHAPESEQALLRRLRMHAMAGALIDEPAVIAACAREAGIDPAALSRATAGDPAVEEELRADMTAARAPSVAALALGHKLAPAAQLGFRYTCPSYEIERTGGNGWPRFDAPGFQPVEVYEAAIANLAPELDRRAAPESVAEVLAWAGEPLAAAEVAAICGIERDDAEAQLAAAAAASESDGWWSLRAAAAETIAA